jgi:hypothetical protein
MRRFFFGRNVTDFQNVVNVNYFKTLDTAIFGNAHIELWFTASTSVIL